MNCGGTGVVVGAVGSGRRDKWGHIVHWSYRGHRGHMGTRGTGTMEGTRGGCRSYGGPGGEDIWGTESMKAIGAIWAHQRHRECGGEGLEGSKGQGMGRDIWGPEAPEGATRGTGNVGTMGVTGWRLRGYRGL